MDDDGLYAAINVCAIKCLAKGRPLKYDDGHEFSPATTLQFHEWGLTLNENRTFSFSSYT